MERSLRNVKHVSKSLISIHVLLYMREGLTLRRNLTNIENVVYPFMIKEHFLRITEFILEHRPYKCRECGNVFVQSSPLTDHQGSHTGGKLYIWGLSGKAFNHPLKLTQNILILE